MKPTDEQLRDPKWWDENAPKDAKYYFEPKSGNKNPAFFARTCSGNTGTNCSGESYHVFFQYWGQPIPRPTKPAAPEWDGEVLPNIGEMVMHPRYAEPCKLRWLGKSYCVIESSFGDEYFAAMEDLEPIRTKEQRQRKELVDLMESERENYFPKAVTAEEIADAILSRYNLEPKDA